MNLAPELNQKVFDGRLAKHVACEEDQADDQHHRQKGAHLGSVGVGIQGRRGFAAADPTRASTGLVARARVRGR